MPTIELSAGFVSSAVVEPGRDRSYFWDRSLPGFGLMVTAKGAKSYVVQYRAAGTSRRMTIPASKPLTDARREAKGVLGAAARGGDPMAEKRRAREARADTVRRAVEDEYFEDSQIASLRTFPEKQAVFRRYIFPALGSRPMAEIKRSEIVRVLGRVQKNNGPAAANHAFKEISRFFNWHAAREDDFRSPIVRGTFTQTKGDGARTLTDDEIRILWKVSGEAKGPYDHLVRLILLTATRLNESACMARGELSTDGLDWTIPAARYKGQDGKSAHAHLIPLSKTARDVLAAIPLIEVRSTVSEWIFTTTGTTPISGFSKFKKAFDRRLHKALDAEGEDVNARICASLNERYPGKGFQPFDAKWQTHSLRKTARTLMDRIGVPEGVAEKCLGHVRGGIVGIYNHHEAKREKRDAFEALAREIDRIAHGLMTNVVTLKHRAFSTAGS